MFKRTIGALIVAAVVVPAIWFGGAPLFALILGLSIVGVLELSNILVRKGICMYVPIAVAFCVPIVGSAYFNNIAALTGSLSLGAIVAMSLPVLRSGKSSYVDGMATAFGVLYIPFMLAHMLLLRNKGIWFVVLLVVCTWATDVFAYLTGMLFGKHRLAPAVSPKKSWEGAFGGALASVAVGAYLSGHVGLSVAGGALLGAFLGSVGQVGDLAESALKRFGDVKDSGNLIPGHGGVLDRFDSMLVNGVLAYYLTILLR